MSIKIHNIKLIYLINFLVLLKTTLNSNTNIFEVQPTSSINSFNNISIFVSKINKSSVFRGSWVLKEGEFQYFTSSTGTIDYKLELVTKTLYLSAMNSLIDIVRLDFRSNVYSDYEDLDKSSSEKKDSYIRIFTVEDPENYNLNENSKTYINSEGNKQCMDVKLKISINEISLFNIISKGVDEIEISLCYPYDEMEEKEGKEAFVQKVFCSIKFMNGAVIEFESYENNYIFQNNVFKYGLIIHLFSCLQVFMNIYLLVYIRKSPSNAKNVSKK